MIDTSKLKGLLAEKNISQAQMAKILGITPETFYRKMKVGIFNNREIDIMMFELKINDPRPIFFSNYVSLHDTT